MRAAERKLHVKAPEIPQDPLKLAYTKVLAANSRKACNDKKVAEFWREDAGGEKSRGSNWKSLVEAQAQFTEVGELGGAKTESFQNAMRKLTGTVENW